MESVIESMVLSYLKIIFNCALNENLPFSASISYFKQIKPAIRVKILVYYLTPPSWLKKYWKHICGHIAGELDFRKGNRISPGLAQRQQNISIRTLQNYAKPADSFWLRGDLSRTGTAIVCRHISKGRAKNG